MPNIKETIKKINLFAHLEDNSIEKLASIAHLSKFEKDSILYYESDSIDNLLFLIEAFGKIILQKLAGNKNIYHNYIETKISEELKNKKGRTTIIPGFFNGRSFTPAQKRLPGMIGVLHNCNSMIVLGKNNEFISKESIVKVLPINWKFFTHTYEDFFN